MQEGVSFPRSAEVPVVMLNVSRGRPGIGGIQPGQADYYQVTRRRATATTACPCSPPTHSGGVDLIYEAHVLAD